MPQSFTFEFGPVTVTVDGVPDSVLPSSFRVDLDVFPHYGADAADRLERFVATVAALGGPEAFGVTTASTDRNSVSLRDDAHPEGVKSSLTLYLPDDRPSPRQHAALAALLEGDAS